MLLDPLQKAIAVGFMLGKRAGVSAGGLPSIAVSAPRYGTSNWSVADNTDRRVAFSACGLVAAHPRAPKPRSWASG
jgi:hypothetical protein